MFTYVNELNCFWLYSCFYLIYVYSGFCVINKLGLFLVLSLIIFISIMLQSIVKICRLFFKRIESQIVWTNIIIATAIESYIKQQK